jgi:carbonic anhydrase
MTANDEFRQIIERLKKGNDECCGRHGKALAQHAGGQNPYAAILACSDSRVVPEIIFSTTLGEIFVVRVAGNVVVDPTVIASFEYAVERLGVRLILVLGHTDCGAVREAESSTGEHGPLLGEIRAGFSMDSDHVTANVMRQASMLTKRSVSLSKAYAVNRLKIIGAVYDLGTGRVRFL